MMAQALLVRRLEFDLRIRAVAKGRARTVHSLKCIAFMVQKTLGPLKTRAKHLEADQRR